MNQPGSFTTLEQWLPWLGTLSPREIDLGLDRVSTVLGVLNLPRAERIINVAGTNGKGSSVAVLEALLATAGHKTGCYTHWQPPMPLSTTIQALLGPAESSPPRTLAPRKPVPMPRLRSNGTQMVWEG